MSDHPHDALPHRHARPIPSEPGEIRWAPVKSLWMLALMGIVAWWGPQTLSLGAIGALVVISGPTLCLGHSVGLHRGLIHRSYEASRAYWVLVAWLGTLTGMGGVLSMMRMHELRDYWQNQPDCPEYYCYDHGMWRDYLWYVHMRYTPHEPRFVARLPEAIEADPVLRFLERTWMLQQVPVALVLWLLGGWGWVVWGVCARVVIGLMGHWFVNYVVHTGGYVNYRIDGGVEQGGNHALLGILSMGEGWHNNHHVFPNSAQMGIRPWELDLGYALVRVLERLGIIWDVKTVATASRKPNASAVDEALAPTLTRAGGAA